MSFGKAPLAIDAYLGKAKNRIAKVGVELEGGWKVVPPGIELHHDGSVAVSPPDGTRVRSGELPSPPLLVKDFPVWMKQYYPSHVNATCGMHVHMSFESALHYSRLMTPEYPATIVEYVRQWATNEKLPATHPIWDRVSGKSRYCRLEFDADRQIRATSKAFTQDRPGHRYTVINFCYSYHGTLECRLLPMMDTAEQGIEAVQLILDITNAALLSMKKKEEKVQAGVLVDSGMVGDQETFTEYA